MNDGGNAFPMVEPEDKPGVSTPYFSHGMSLRDWFAGNALQGMIAGKFSPPYEDRKDVLEAVAECAYLYADAMLAERAKGTS